MPEKLATGTWEDALAAAANATALNFTLNDVSFNEFNLDRALRVVMNTGSDSASVSVVLDGCSMKGAKVLWGVPSKWASAWIWVWACTSQAPAASACVMQPSVSVCAAEAGCSQLPALPPSACASTPQVHVARAAEYAGSRDFAITARDCVFESNVLNVTGAVAAQGSLSVGLKLLGSGESVQHQVGRLWQVGTARPTAACWHATSNLQPASQHPPAPVL